jgi:threonyl-tRNA synthetase
VFGKPHQLNQHTTTQPHDMADAIKEAVNDAVEGVKNLAVSNDQKPVKEKKEKKKKGGEGGDARPLELDPKPAFFDHRVQIL